MTLTARQAKLITLEAWLSLTYADGPTIETARRWCRDGLIHPLPQKHGRTYYVSPEARYTRGSARLVDRLRDQAANEQNQAAAA